MTLEARIQSFARDLVLPAFREVAASPRLAREHTVFVIDDTVDDPLHAAMIDELIALANGRVGPVLLIEERELARRVPPFGGRFLVAPVLREVGEVVVAAPLVLYQMQFDRRLHGFAHRYAAHSEQPVDTVTRAMIVNHVLNSFSYYKLHASSPTRPW